LKALLADLQPNIEINSRETNAMYHADTVCFLKIIFFRIELFADKKLVRKNVQILCKSFADKSVKIFYSRCDCGSPQKFFC